MVVEDKKAPVDLPVFSGDHPQLLRSQQHPIMIPLTYPIIIIISIIVNTMNIVAFIVILLAVKEGHGSTYIISEEFHTNHFTNNDFNAWTLSGSSLPPRRFTTCGTARLFGGTIAATKDTKYSWAMPPVQPKSAGPGPTSSPITRFA